MSIYLFQQFSLYYESYISHIRCMHYNALISFSWYSKIVDWEKTYSIDVIFILTFHVTTVRNSPLSELRSGFLVRFSLSLSLNIYPLNKKSLLFFPSTYINDWFLLHFSLIFYFFYLQRYVLYFYILSDLRTFTSISERISLLPLFFIYLSRTFWFDIITKSLFLYLTHFKLFQSTYLTFVLYVFIAILYLIIDCHSLSFWFHTHHQIRLLLFLYYVCICQAIIVSHLWFLLQFVRSLILLIFSSYLSSIIVAFISIHRH